MWEMREMWEIWEMWELREMREVWEIWEGEERARVVRGRLGRRLGCLTAHLRATG